LRPTSRKGCEKLTWNTTSSWTTTSRSRRWHAGPSFAGVGLTQHAGRLSVDLWLPARGVNECRRFLMPAFNPNAKD
jgi:hypothetical protein